MTYLYLKSLHIILVITWFAGLFYLVRLFIYATEANAKPEPERSILLNQFKVMQNRLWFIITQPSALLTLFIGIWLSVETKFYYLPWFHLKVFFLVLLYSYHFLCDRIRKNINNNHFKYTSTQLRIWNEVSTVLLFAIVFLVVLKSTLGWIWGVLGLVVLSVVLMIGIKTYKKFRNDE